jgi:chromosomal replication initiation ATPase DnaA
MSLQNLGKIFNRDHATVIASLKAVEKRMNSESGFSAEMSDLRKEITG